MYAGDGDRLAGQAAHPEFATTHWSRVLAAAMDGSLQTNDALEDLCRTYWYPLYAYVRRRGYSAHDAQDLTQAFFARLLERRDLRHVDRAKGKFRSYLLASLNHFLSNEWDRMRAERRGGGQVPVSLDAEDAEQRYMREPMTEATPDEVFEVRWAVAVMDRALAALRRDFECSGRAEDYERLKDYLTREAAPGEYESLAQSLAKTPNAVAQTVRRLRQAYRQCVRTEVAQTVSSLSEINEEMRHLFGVLTR